MLTPQGSHKPRPGIETWTNPLNGFIILRLHYTADPTKRTAEWKAATSRSMHPRAWRREYEIDWASPEGEPVTPEFDEAIHVRDFGVEKNLRLLRFWDFGFDSPVVLFAQLTLWDQLRVLYELCPFNTPLKLLIPAAEAIAKELMGVDAYLGGDRATDFAGRDPDDERAVWKFDTAIPGQEVQPALRTFDAGDPEGYSRKSLGIEAQVMGQFGLRLHTTRPGHDQSYQNLRDRLLRTVMVPGAGRQPALLIHSRCRLLREALSGAFCRSTTPPYKPRKTHPHGDLVDSLRYGNDNLHVLKAGRDQRLHRLATSDIQETRA